MRSSPDPSGSTHNPESELELLSHVLSCIGAGFIVCDRDGNMRIYNRMAAEITGVERRDIPPEQWTEQYGLFHLDETTPFAMEELPLVRAIRGEDVRGFRMFLRNASVGRGRHLSVTATPIRTVNGDPHGAVCVFEDITERVETEASLRRAERMAALGTMAAGLAHEINNPIAAAQTSAEAARNLLARGETGGLLDCLDNMSASLQRVTVLVRSMLSFSRERAGQYSLHDLNSVVVSSIEMVRSQVEENGASIEVGEADSLSSVAFDPVQIQQVLVNLIRNAVASGDHVRIVVRTKRSADAAIVEVEDDGRGMSVVERERAFDPFFTNPLGDGTGLGLALVHRVVVDHGGDVSIESAPGAGTTVVVRLPLPVETPQ